MPELARVGPIQEYAALRDELSQSKKYVFERPLIIAGVGVALLRIESVTLNAVVPALLVGLLLFNYWFTVNRLRSASRIAAYIQVALEGSGQWRGWETSLRAYRLWMADYSGEKERRVETELKGRVAPDALMYYRPIYLLHITLVLLGLAIGIKMTLDEATAINVTSAAILVLLAVVFARDGWRWRPSKMKCLIERNAVIWQLVLGKKK